MDEKKSPVFVLGVGAQKAGTSWLHNYLNSLPEVDLGFMKEYHVLDQKHVKDKTPRRIVRIRNWFASFLGTDSMSLRYKFRRNNKHYFDYFQKLVASNPEVLITGDITPTYAAIPPAAMLKAKRSLEKKGFKVKVIFLMRDPVERCISANRMYLKPNQNEIDLDPDLEAARLESTYSTLRFKIRTRYDITIKNLEEVFPSSDIYYGFYEELFSKNSVAAICEFLGLPFREANYDTIVNGSKVRGVIPSSLKSKIRFHYDPVYEYVASKFGRTRIMSLWKNF